MSSKSKTKKFKKKVKKVKKTVQELIDQEPDIDFWSTYKTIFSSLFIKHAAVD